MFQTGKTVGRQILRGRNDTRIRATWRILLPFAIFIGIYGGGVALLRPQQRLPDVLLNGSGAVVVFLAVGTVLLVSSRFLDNRPRSAYGLELGRQWWLDFVAAIGIGFLFQALLTVLFLEFGAGRIAGTFSMGVADDTVSLAVALVATVVGFLSVATWEEVLFRGVFIRNAIEGIGARGGSRRTAVGGAWLVSALVFGLPHIGAVADGVTGAFAAAQAILAGGYFALAYVLTDSLAFPIGLHFATDFWTVSIVGQPGSSFPALLRMERDLQLGWELGLTVLLPVAVLCGLILAWVYVTRGGISIDTRVWKLAAESPAVTHSE